MDVARKARWMSRGRRGEVAQKAPWMSLKTANRSVYKQTGWQFSETHRPLVEQESRLWNMQPAQAARGTCAGSWNMRRLLEHAPARGSGDRLVEHSARRRPYDFDDPCDGGGGPCDGEGGDGFMAG